MNFLDIVSSFLEFLDDLLDHSACTMIAKLIDSDVSCTKLEVGFSEMVFEVDVVFFCKLVCASNHKYCFGMLCTC